MKLISISKPIYGMAIALIVAAVIIHFIAAGTSSATASAFRNDLHSPAFLIFTVVLYRAFRFKAPPRHAIFMSAAFALGTGMLGELAQFIGFGQASLADLGRDVVGISAGLILGTSFDRSIRRSTSRITKWLLGIASVSILLFVLSPAVKSAIVLRQQQSALPSIASFDEPWERHFFFSSNDATIILSNPPNAWPVQYGEVAIVALSKKGYSGIEIDPASDWSNYDYLSFVIASGNSRDHDVILRIDDEVHTSHFKDRFGRSFSVTPEPTTFRIPLTEIRDAPAGRSMQMDAIRSVIFYKRKPDGDEILLLDEVRLEGR